jgi:hypothetical protein
VYSDCRRIDAEHIDEGDKWGLDMRATFDFIGGVGN